MKIIEQFSHGKVADNSYCEDRFAIGTAACAVIDGSRGPGHMETPMIQTALDRAADIIAAVGPDMTPRALFDDLTRSLAATKTEFRLDEHRYTGGYHVVCYSAAHRQIWRVGDCQYRFGGTTYRNDLELEEIGARQRAVWIHSLLVRGQTADDVMASETYATMFLPFFAPLLDFANRPDHRFGFGVVNGMAIPDKFIEVHDIPPAVPEIILTSDGYPLVCDTLADSEDALMALVKTDPLCINENITSKGLMPGQVSFDDRTWLRIGL